MAPVGTVQFLLSGTCRKHIYPESAPLKVSPEWQSGHPCYSQPKSSPAQKCRQVSPARGAWHRVPGALSHSRDVGWRGVPPGREGMGQGSSLSSHRSVASRFHML